MLIYADALIYVAKWLVAYIVVVSSVQVVKPHARLAGFALVGGLASCVHDLIKWA